MEAVTTDDVPAPVAAVVPPLVRLLALLLLTLLWPLLLCARGWWALRSHSGGDAPIIAQKREIACLPYRRVATASPTTFSLVQFQRRGAPAVATPGASHLLTVLIPALPAVVAGRMALVGVTARTPEELAAVPDPWQRMISAAPVGVITSALFVLRRSGSVRWNGSAADSMTVFADSAYCTTRSPRQDTALFCRYLLWCLRPGGGA